MDVDGTGTRRGYVSHYGITLLDDLYNYFPAILYDTGRFNTIQDFLGYIQTQIRAFELEPLSEVQSEASALLGLASTSTSTTGPIRRLSPRRNSAVRRVDQLPLPPTNLIESTMAQVNNSDFGSDFGSDFDIIFSRLETISYERTADPHILMRPTRDTTRTQPLLSSSSLINLLTTMIHDDTTTDNFLTPVIVRPSNLQVQSATSTGILRQPPVDNAVAPFCSICQDTMAVGDNYRTINICSHTFHKECIDAWFMTHYICPVCRHDIREGINAMEQMD